MKIWQVLYLKFHNFLQSPLPPHFPFGTQKRSCSWTTMTSTKSKTKIWCRVLGNKIPCRDRELQESGYDVSAITWLILPLLLWPRPVPSKVQLPVPGTLITLPKGVYSFRYFLSPMRIPNLLMNVFIMLILLLFAHAYMYFAWELQLDTQCVYLVYALRSSQIAIKMHICMSRQEKDLAKWIYASPDLVYALGTGNTWMSIRLLEV